LLIDLIQSGDVTIQMKNPDDITRLNEKIFQSGRTVVNLQLQNRMLKEVSRQPGFAVTMLLELLMKELDASMMDEQQKAQSLAEEICTWWDSDEGQTALTELSNRVKPNPKPFDPAILDREFNI
jgi:hypothetical protein